jgi:hypothetical protein
MAMSTKAKKSHGSHTADGRMQVSADLDGAASARASLALVRPSAAAKVAIDRAFGADHD